MLATTLTIAPGDLTDPRIVALLDTHVTAARAESPRESAHALEVSELQTPDIDFWAAWEGEVLAAVGALKRMEPGHGELKSMHTAKALRGRGVGAAMLRHLIAEGRAQGLRRLSLETGAMAYFEPARTLYRRHGFDVCGPYGAYKLDPNSVYMTLDLTLDDH
jgi:putative acetyltransferase